MTTSAFLLIGCELGTEKELLKELNKIGEITEAHMIYGAYDLIVKVEAQTLPELKEVIAEKIRKLNSIRSIINMIII